ncbi:MAG: hypothetical protein HYZ45_06355 [Burkholderiales bacterium]|nr:hypothetical protein [Burkholderiales bacterium]
MGLPPEAMAILGGESKVWLLLDSDKHTITISAIAPEIQENNAILDQLAELNEGLTLEEYAAPVPESFLKSMGSDSIDLRDAATR